MSKVSKQTHLADIEVYRNFFFLGVRDYRAKTELRFELSEFVDDRERLYKYLTEFKGYFVTFNGIHYDEVILSYFVMEYDTLKYLPIHEVTRRLKAFSNDVINDNFEAYKLYKWNKKDYISIDLFLYWSKMLRISKKISLKGLGIQLHHPEVQELPYHHESVLNQSQIQDVKYYNLVNDLGILERLFEEQKPQIALRYYINQEYKINCWSMDAPKIAGELMLQDYCTKNQPKDKRLNAYMNEVRKSQFFAGDLTISNIIGDFNPNFRLPIFKDFWKRVLASDRGFKEKFVLNHGKTSLRMSYGIGGAHSAQTNKCYKSTDTHIIVTSDYASLYPNIIINYLCIRFKEVLEKYAAVKADRIEAKKNKDKMKDTLLKLILNSLSGLLDQEKSWLYYPEGALKMRIIGQMIITKTMEIVLENGWEIISVNTDGIECIIPKEDYEKYVEVLKEAEQLFKIDLEHEIYDQVNYLNVNNYHVVKNGSAKRKGSFKLDFDEYGNREIPLGDSINQLVVAKALNLYLTKEIKLEESIKNPEKYGFSIYDYTLSNKIAKVYEVYHGGALVQNLNRYYFSKSQPFLFKLKKGKTVMEHVNVGNGVMLFNKYVEKPFDEYEINYDYYIAEARKKLNELMSEKIQLSLF